MALALIALGANLGPRDELIARAVRLLGEEPGLRLLRQSAVLETVPAGGPPGQPGFLNAAVLVESSLPPAALLGVLRRTEAALGRQRGVRWGPRTIDLDLLLYDDVVMQTAELVLPHPRMAFRRFVLEPACQIAADLVHPTIGWTIARLRRHLDEGPDYIALAGPIAAGKTELAHRVAAERPLRLALEAVPSGSLGRFYADPSGRAWQTELEFLDQRAGLLARDRPWWSPGGTVLSDFWFDQSLAFARVWLSDAERQQYEARFAAAAAAVVPAKLLVVLDVPVDELPARIARRGRPYEQGLERGRLAAIRESVLAAAAARRGPTLVLKNPTPDVAAEELDGAIAGLR